jgi:hypothetical protein
VPVEKRVAPQPSTLRDAPKRERASSERTRANDSARHSKLTAASSGYTGERGSRHDKASAPVSQPTVAPAADASEQQAVQSAEAQKAPSNKAPVAVVNASRRPKDDPLARELALLDRARAALSSDRPSVALGLAEQHASQFPRGALRQEALATRVLALCALGRKQESDAALHELEQTARRSPHLMGISARCAVRADSHEAP